MKQVKNKVQLIHKRNILYSLCIAGVLIGCSNGGFDSQTPSGNNIVTEKEPQISFDEVATVPLMDKKSIGSYLVKISNTFDQKYNLRKIQVINPLTGKEDSSLATINSKLCSYIPANGSCSINVTPNLSKSGSFIIEAILSGEDKKIKTIRQIIRVSDKIVSNKGIAFKNDISKIVSTNGKYGLSIPVVLTEDFDDIKATNGSLVCNGGFKKNSNCSYLLSGDTLGDNTLVETKLTGYRKGKIVSSTSYTTRVATAISANLLLSQPEDIVIERNETDASGVVSAADNTSTLTIYNSGNFNATDIASEITNGALRIVSGDDTTCGTLLAPHSSCNIQVEASGQSNGNGSIQVDYRPHVDADNLNSASANILYMVAGEALPGTSFENVAGGLENTARGTTSTQDIRIANNGRYNLTDLKFSLNQDSNSNGSFVISPTPAADDGSVHPCNISGTQELVTPEHLEAIATTDETTTDETEEAATPVSFCDLRISYTAPNAEVNGNVSLTVAGNYQDGQGSSQSYSNTASYDYSAVNAFDVLTISPIHAVNLSAPPSGNDSEEFILTNVSSQELVLGTLNFADPIAGISREEDIPDVEVCNTGSTLAGGASCTVRINYAPTAEVDRTGTNFNIPVASVGGINTDDTVHAIPTWVVSAVGAGGTSNITTTVTAGGSGVANNIAPGANGSTIPYQFILSNGHLIDFTYTFTNAVGASPAMHFNVATSSLPVQAEVTDGTDCPVGSVVGNLAAGSSCNVVVRVPRASAVTAGLITDNATTEINLPYSWTDSAGINTEANEASNRSVIIRTGWASDLAATATGSFTEEGVYQVTVNTTISGLANNSGAAFPITVTPVFTGATDVQTCTLTDADRTCASTFNLPLSMPQGEYSVVVRLTAGTGNTASTQQTTATLNVIRGMMFLSAPLTTLNFGGYAAADAICNADTNRPAGYLGLSYRAMLPARTDPIFVIGRDYYSNNNLNGTTPRLVATANNAQFLTDQALTNAISSTANTFIAVGAYTGNATTATGNNCNVWSSNEASVNFVQGNVAQTGAIWRGDGAGNTVACSSTTHRLLCVAQ